MQYLSRKRLLTLIFALIVSASALGFVADQALHANGFDMYLPAIMNGSNGGGTVPN